MNSVKCNAWGKLFTTNLGLTPKTSGRLASLKCDKIIFSVNSKQNF